MMFVTRFKEGFWIGQKSLSLVWRSLQLMVYSLLIIIVHWGIPLLLYWYHTTHTMQQPFVMPGVEMLDLTLALSQFAQSQTPITIYGLAFASVFITQFIRFFLEFCLIYHAAHTMHALPISIARSIRHTVRRIATVIYAVFVYAAGSFLLAAAGQLLVTLVESPATRWGSAIFNGLLSSLQFPWYLLTLFMAPLLIFSKTSVLQTLKQSLVIIWRQLAELIGGNVSIFLTGLIVIPITFVGPVILISLSPDYYLGLLLMITTPFTAFFSAASMVLLIYIYERWTGKKATAIE